VRRATENVELKVSANSTYEAGWNICYGGSHRVRHSTENDSVPSHALPNTA